MSKALQEGVDYFYLRMDSKILDKIKRLAKRNNSSANRQIEKFCLDGLGIQGSNPCIVGSADNLYWVSPTGFYGELSPMIFRRFCAGGVPLVGDDWDDVYDDMRELCKELGKVICELTSRGIMVYDYRRFIYLATDYQNEN